MRHVRWLPLLVLLAGCGPGPSGGDGDSLVAADQLLPRPRQAEMARFYSHLDEDEEEDDGPRGAPRALVLTLEASATAAVGTVAMMGVRAEQLDGGWVRGRTRPEFFWVSEEVALGPEITLAAPLVKGLSYIAVINQNSDPLPGPGDLVGGPVELGLLAPGGDALRVLIDRPFEEATGRPTQGRLPGRPPEGRPSAEDSEQFWALRLEPEADVPPGTRLVLLGRRAGVQSGGRGLWSWTSEPLEGPFPLVFAAPLPEDGMELLGFLDGDGDGRPGPDDLCAERIEELRRPGTEGELTVRFRRGGPAGALDELRELARAAQTGVERRSEQRTVERTLVLEAREKAPSAFGVVLVASWPPFQEGEPTNIWRSQPLPLAWPLELRAPLDRGQDLLIAVDLHEDGVPGPGDLASPRLYRFEPPPAGQPVEVELLQQ